jgi:hypothetical protein
LLLRRPTYGFSRERGKKRVPKNELFEIVLSSFNTSLHVTPGTEGVTGLAKNVDGKSLCDGGSCKQKLFFSEGTKRENLKKCWTTKFCMYFGHLLRGCSA